MQQELIIAVIMMCNNENNNTTTLSQTKSQSPQKICHGWSRCNGICLVSGPDVSTVCKQKSDVRTQFHQLQP